MARFRPKHAVFLCITLLVVSPIVLVPTELTPGDVARMAAWPHMLLMRCAAISSLVVGVNLLSIGIREIGLRD
jgi:hypothetical protein